MEKLVLTVLVLFIAFNIALNPILASNPTDFIRASCKVTRYPDLCLECLSGYVSAIKQNDQYLSLTALSVSLDRAKSTASFVTTISKVRGIKPREYHAVRDCIENMGDSVYRLSESFKELIQMGRTVGEDFIWHMSNVQTWVSAALTDENTCMDGFARRSMDGNVKSAIKRRIDQVAKVTSNALALVNRFASSRHKQP